MKIKKLSLERPFFSAIKYKLLSAIAIFTVILGISFMVVMRDTYKHYHSLQLTECFSNVKEEINKIENSIITLNTTIADLALIGVAVPKLPHSEKKKYAESAIVNLIKNNENATGVGLWYHDSKNTNYYAHRYVYDILIDDSNYNYKNQIWYKEITDALKNSKKSNYVEWSAPYYDEHANKALMITIGTDIKDENDNTLGLATLDWKLDDIAKQISEINIVRGSFSILIDLRHNILLASTAPDKADVSTSIKETLNSNNLELVSSSQAIIETQINGKKYFSFTTRFSNDLALFVFVPEKRLLKEIRQVTLVSVFILIIAALIAAIAIWKMLDSVINTPIKILSKAAMEIKKGKYDIDLKYHSNDEFQELTETFSTMVHDIKEHIEKIDNINAERHRMETELNISYNIQKSMLPSVYPPFPHRSDINIRGIMKPAKEVSGDFYDFFFCDESHLAFVIADVSDKGVPAALFMVKAKTIIHTAAMETKEPGEILTKVNELLCIENDNCMFVTAITGILNTQNGELLCANAGHDPFYILYGDNNIKKITLDPGLPLGVKKGTVYGTSKFNLLKNSTIFMYTDGVIDAVNSENELFGTKRLENAIKANQEFLPRLLKKFISNMMLEIKEYTKKTKQSDDITMLILSYFGEPEPIIYTHTFKAKHSELELFMTKIEDILNQGNFSDKQKNRFRVGAEELFVNIINYSYPNTNENNALIYVNITLTQNPSALRLQLKDYGLPFNVIEHDDPDLSLQGDSRPIGGLGIFITKQGCNKLKYQRKDNQNIVTMFLEEQIENSKSL